MGFNLQRELLKSAVSSPVYRLKRYCIGGLSVPPNRARLFCLKSCMEIWMWKSELGFAYAGVSEIVNRIFKTGNRSIYNSSVHCLKFTLRIKIPHSAIWMNLVLTVTAVLHPWHCCLFLIHIYMFLAYFVSR